MKILVTGGAGYIGSFMTKRLLERGDSVVVLDSLERGHKEAIDPKAEFMQANLWEWDKLESIFQKHSFDAIMHFAGYISMEESMRDPRIYFYNNTGGSLELMEHARKTHVKFFIFSSSAGVYGNPTKLPITEDHPKNPTNPYGESKLMVEKMLSWYQKIYGLNFAALRYFNAAGAALDGTRGEDHDPESHIIPLAIRAALGDKEFNLYGTDYETADGTCVRDYIHVLDLVEAHVLALEKLGKDGGGFAYNVGTGKGYSNKEVLEMIKKVSGRELKVIERPRRPGDANELVADVSKIKEELGFIPKYSDLKTITETAWKWHKRSS